MTKKPSPLLSIEAPLSTVFTIPKVAKMVGWKVKRLRRHLLAANAEAGGMLLANVSHGDERPRWTITLGALKALHPQWFHDPENLQRQIDKLKEENADLRRKVVMLERISDMHTDGIASLMKKKQTATAAVAAG